MAKLNVNGKIRDVQVEADTPLLWVIREQVGLTGTKYGCGEGQCGACTVLLNGKPRRSCQLSVSDAAGKSIVTIEGFEREGRLHPVQQAFLEVEAFQCGYCTSGMVMAAVGLLKTNPNPSEQDIARLMDRSVCRCGTYPRIVKAVRLAADRMKTSTSSIGGGH